MFRDVSSTSLALMGDTLAVTSFPAGHVISREAEEGRTLYLIVSGTVAIEKKTFQDAERAKVVARLGPGDFFGEMSFLQGTPHSATVVALTGVDVITISRESLDELIKQDSASALEQVLTLATGLSGRLRSTTRELVTVFEVAHSIASATTVEQLARLVVGQLQLDLGAAVSIAFYQWNIYNRELNAIEREGANAAVFPASIDDPAALVRLLNRDPMRHSDAEAMRIAAFDGFKSGPLFLAPVRSSEEPFGLFVYHSETPAAFDAGERQMMETVAAVMAPALASLYHREEEAARKRLEQSKQGGLTF
jgi:CRP-like cAMP-binding protein